MRRHLNTIYVTSEGAYCRKDGANIVVEVDKQERGRAPIHVIGGLVCLGRASISPSLMNACTEAGVTISFLTEHGRFLARVEGPRSGNVLVRGFQISDQIVDVAKIRSLEVGRTCSVNRRLSVVVVVCVTLSRNDDFGSCCADNAALSYFSIAR